MLCMYIVQVGLFGKDFDFVDWQMSVYLPYLKKVIQKLALLTILMTLFKYGTAQRQHCTRLCFTDE